MDRAFPLSTSVSSLIKVSRRARHDLCQEHFSSAQVSLTFLIALVS